MDIWGQEIGEGHLKHIQRKRSLHFVRAGDVREVENSLEKAGS